MWKWRLKEFFKAWGLIFLGLGLWASVFGTIVGLVSTFTGNPVTWYYILSWIMVPILISGVILYVIW